MYLLRLLPKNGSSSVTAGCLSQAVSAEPHFPVACSADPAPRIVTRHKTTRFTFITQKHMITDHWRIIVCIHTTLTPKLLLQWWQWSHYHYLETSLNLQMSWAFIGWNSSKKLSHLRAPPFLYNVTLTLFSIMAGSGNWPGLLPAELRTWICCLRSPISLLLAATSNLYCSSHLWFTSRIFWRITEHSLTLQV